MRDKINFRSLLSLEHNVFINNFDDENVKIVQKFIKDVHAIGAYQSRRPRNHFVPSGDSSLFIPCVHFSKLNKTAWFQQSYDNVKKYNHLFEKNQFFPHTTKHKCIVTHWSKSLLDQCQQEVCTTKPLYVHEGITWTWAQYERRTCFIIKLEKDHPFQFGVNWDKYEKANMRTMVLPPATYKVEANFYNKKNDTIYALIACKFVEEKSEIFIPWEELITRGDLTIEEATKQHLWKHLGQDDYSHIIIIWMSNNVKYVYENAENILSLIKNEELENIRNFRPLIIIANVDSHETITNAVQSHEKELIPLFNKFEFEIEKIMKRHLNKQNRHSWLQQIIELKLNNSQKTKILSMLCEDFDASDDYSKFKKFMLDSIENFWSGSTSAKLRKKSIAIIKTTTKLDEFLDVLNNLYSITSPASASINELRDFQFNDEEIKEIIEYDKKRNTRLASEYVPSRY